MQDSPASRRRIPDGAFVTHINGEETDYKSLKDVKTMVQNAERPVKIDFAQSETSRALAESSRRAAAGQSDEQAAAAQKVIDDRKARELARKTTTLETTTLFSRTYTEKRLGMCLLDGGGEERRKGRTYVARCLPGSPRAGGVVTGVARPEHSYSRTLPPFSSFLCEISWARKVSSYKS